MENKVCKIFGHKYRCSMGCQSVCSRCGDVYSYNVTVCYNCGGKLSLIYKKGYGKVLLCKKGCVEEKYWKHWKMSKEEYEQKIKEGIASKGIIYNFLCKKRTSEICSKV